tara:strand:- start:850 stop:1173 length:324 start_codon:yes stop_codon:yes gene_type:complete
MKSILNTLSQVVLSTAKMSVDIVQTTVIIADESCNLAASAIIKVKGTVANKLDPDSITAIMLDGKSFRDIYRDSHDNRAGLSQVLDKRLTMEEYMGDVIKRTTSNLY